MAQTEIMLVKPWSKDHGDHVVINKDDFNPEFHVAFDAPAEAGETKPRKTRAAKQEAPAEAGEAQE